MSAGLRSEMRRDIPRITVADIPPTRPAIATDDAVFASAVSSFNAPSSRNSFSVIDAESTLNFPSDNSDIFSGVGSYRRDPDALSIASRFFV